MFNKYPKRLNRAHNSKPYDRPKSLFQKITSTLQEILLPSWLTYDPPQEKEFSSTNQDNEVNVEQQTVYQTDFNNAFQPVDAQYIPSRRPCCSSYNKLDGTDKAKDFELPGSENTEENVSSSANTYQRKSSIQQTINGDDHSENSEGSASTSGCSSLISSHQERRDHDPGLRINENSLEQLKKDLTEKQLLRKKSEKRHIAVGTDSSNQEIDDTFNKTHTLWYDKDLHPSKRARPQPTIVGRNPSFTLSSFGAPLLGDSSQSNKCVHSPFYEGKTMFGGASGLRRSQILSSVYQSSRLHNEKLKVKESTSSKNDFDYMSTTAKRILLSLEKMSTPLEDAKKIPAEKKSSLGLALSARQKMNSSISLSREKYNKFHLKGPPKSGVLIPSFSKIGKNLEPKASSAEQIKAPDETTACSVNNSHDIYVIPTTSSSCGKVRMKMHSSLHHTRKNNSDEVIDIPVLPNVPLPVDQLPTFNFHNLTKVSNNSVTTVESTGTVFTFSSPIQHNAPLASCVQSSETSFKFSFPAMKTQDIPLSNDKTEEKSELAEKSHLCSSGSLEKSAVNEVSELKPFSHNTNTEITSYNKGEDMQIEKEMQIHGFGDKFKPPVGSWECNTCLVRNQDSNMCIACKTPRTDVIVSSQSSEFADLKSSINENSEKLERMTHSVTTKNKDPIVTSESFQSKTEPLLSSGFGDKFKPPVGNWSCPTCMISNSSSKMNCAACETPKPQSNHSPSSGQLVTAGFGNKFKPAAGSWKCDTCFVQNNSNVLKCVACETPKTDSSNITDTKQVFSGFKFNFSDNQNATFKFGSTTLSNTNTTGSITGFKFGIPNTGGSTGTTAGFKFGMTTLPSNVCSTTEASVGFKFGMTTSPSSVPKTTETATTGFKFGVPSPPASSSNINTTASVDYFKFGAVPKSVENIKTGNADNQLKIANTFVFGEKSSETNSSAFASNGQMQFGVSVPTKENSSNVMFGQKSMSNLAEGSGGFKFGLKSKDTKNSSEMKSEVFVSITTASNITMSPTFSSTSSSLGLSTATTTVSIFNFGKSQPIVSATSNDSSLQKKTETGTNILSSKQNIGFPLSFTTQQKENINLNKDNNPKINENIQQNGNLSTTTFKGATVTTGQLSSSLNTSNTFCFGSPKIGASEVKDSNFVLPFGAGSANISKVSTTSAFTFGSPLTTANNTFAVSTAVTSSAFSFGTYASHPTVSSKPNSKSQPIATNLFGINTNPQASFAKFGTPLSSPFGQNTNSSKSEGFAFQSSQNLSFSTGTTAAAAATPGVFRFGVTQEQKPTENLKVGFTFNASQDQEQKAASGQMQKPSFNFGFNNPQGESNSGTISQENLHFNPSQDSEHDKSKGGFHSVYNPQQIFGSTSTSTGTGTTPVFNFTGNTVPSGTPFSFSASPSNSSGSVQQGRKIKRAVRRSGIASNRRE